MKFFIRQTVRNVVRHRKKSILHILIGVLTVLILDIYAVNMNSTEKQLAHLPEVLEVTARISTLNGSRREGMTIREERMMCVRESEYVKDPVFTVRLKFGFGAFTVEEYKENLNHYGMGMNIYALYFLLCVIWPVSRYSRINTVSILMVLCANCNKVRPHSCKL